jgi:hypothetical protein
MSARYDNWDDDRLCRDCGVMVNAAYLYQHAAFHTAIGWPVAEQPDDPDPPFPMGAKVRYKQSPDSPDSTVRTVERCEGANGADIDGGSFHSWRCFDKERYPERCSCTADVVDEIIVALRTLGDSDE